MEALDAKPVQSNVTAILRKKIKLAIKVEELTTVKARDDLVEDLQKVGEEYSEEKTHALVARLNQKMDSQFLHFL